ncbi:hypothetical protein [Tenacibaculum xiamenense]|uniref:hypothetical protein n=1 Tax=Tenacibaculum xiamenense TaxID=1261553 RepID=UPI0038946BE6
MKSKETSLKKVKERLSRLTDDQLLEIINSNSPRHTSEKFLSKKELEIREYLRYNKKHKDQISENKSKPTKLFIPFYKRFDLKIIFENLFFVLLTISFGSLITYFTIYYIPEPDYSQYDTPTSAIIQNITENNGFSHGASGTSLITNSFNVIYNYEVNQKYYSDTCIILNKLVNAKFLKELNSKLRNGTIPILYESKRPKESIIDRRKFN